MDNEIDFIVNALSRGKCIVILGPDLLQAAGSQIPLRKELHAQKIKGSNGQGDYLEYYQQEELYLFQNPKQQTRFFFSLEDFYKDSQVDKTAYQQLSELPVSLILNGSPDLVLKNIMGIAASFAYYDKGAPNAEVPDFSVKSPLVYNLLGTIEQQESLVLTHDDLFQYLERIFSEGQVPPAILDALFAAKCLLFLGVGFDKWYVQLLLRLLKVTDDRFARYASPKPNNSHTLSICTDQFKIEFVNHQIADFVKKLHAACASRGILESRTESVVVEWYQRVRQRCAAHQHEEALQVIEERLRALKQTGEAVDEWERMLLILEGELGRLRRRFNQRMISQDDFEVAMNNLGERIGMFAKEIFDEHG